MAETGKSFVKNLVGFSLVTWISFVVSFLTAPVATRLFDPDVLGKINIFNTYSSLFGVLILIGLDQAFARFYLERPNNKSVGYLFAFCYGVTYTLIAGFIILSIPIRKWLSLELFDETDNLLLILFYINIFCTVTLRYLNLSYRMEKNVKMYTIQGVLITLASKFIYLCVGFWDPSYKSALIALCILNFVLTVIFLVIQRNRFERIKAIDREFSNAMFKFALPLIPVSVLMWANTSIPQIIIQKTMDYYNIGIFTSAVALANVILVVQSGFNTFWVPYTYENYKTQHGQFFKVHRYLVCALTICSLLLVLSQDVVFLLLGEKYRAAKSFFPFLILGPVCYVIGETTGVGIGISKKTYYNIIVFGVSILINLLLCFLLGQYFGLAGIAMAVALAAITAMLLKTVFGEKYYHLVDSYRYMYICILLIVASALITLFVKEYIWKYSFQIAILMSSLVLFKKEIIELWQFSFSLIKKNKE